jgi:hypothetical protein
LADEIFIDPGISKAKFEREMDRWRALSIEHAKRGIFLVECSFPNVFVIFAAPQLSPAPVVFGVEVNFDNYDFWPPSVRFRNPFTRQPYTKESLPPFWARPPIQEGLPLVPGLRLQPVVMFQDGGEGEAFFCAEGIREYHNHPAHTGNPWLLHRTSGRGSLFHIADKLHEFGIRILKAYAFQIELKGYHVEL